MDRLADACIFTSSQTGFGIGAFFSLMTASFAYEDPFRAPAMEGLNTRQKTVAMFKDMGKGMWSSGKSWGKIGALFAGIECVLEGVSKVKHHARHHRSCD